MSELEYLGAFSRQQNDLCFQDKPFYIIVIQVYAPTTNAEEAEIDWFYEVAKLVKNLPTVQEAWVQFLGWEDPLEKKMATYSSILAWRIPWSLPGSSVHGVARVGHDLATKLKKLHEEPTRSSRTNINKDVPFNTGNCNEKVGSQEIPGVTGKFGLGVQNESGQRLTEFCQENALIIANTLFQQHERQQADGQYQSQIDYEPLHLLVPGLPCGSAGKESACNVGDLGSIPGLGRFSGGGRGYPLQYSGLKNSMDCTVHGVTESDMTEKLSLSPSGAMNIESAKTRPETDCVSDHELLIAKFRLKMKKVGKTIRPFRSHTVEVTNRFKGLYWIDRVPE